MHFKDNFQTLNTIWDRQQLRSHSWIKLEQSREYKIEEKMIHIFWTADAIFFVYLVDQTEKITKKFIRDTILKIENIKHAKYLVLMVQNSHDPKIVWVDLINKTNPKVTTLHIDNKWTFNIDENRTIYKNRTLIEQFQELQKDLKWWERELKVRFLKKFFEKQKLTESFYAIYKTELFDKIKKNLITHFGKEDEDVINNFILINLNRLLFIHFLDKKGGVFKSYEDKRWSYISYLFHKVYKELDTQEPFYQAVLKPLFFEAFNKPYTERKFNHKMLDEEFKDLPYLNWWLFKPTKYEREKHFIDNVFIKSFIINIIDQFNFTITEDTPFEIKISVDPELLWYIFENLIQEYDNNKTKDDERSKWGIFYTPKIEVDFMCRQVLIEYLSKKEELKNKKMDLYKLFYLEKWGRDEQEYGSFNSIQIAAIFRYLEDVKVVDPACGSGAFLVWMMQVILDVENNLLNYNETLLNYSKTPWIEAIKSKSIFQRKKQLIKNTLHGVDIKSWAVEIAKLRLWLSMIVDINERVFQQESVKTKPLLPSFGFKIVQGDSLVNRIGTNLVPINIASAHMLSEKMKENIASLVALKNEYYENDHKDENIIKQKEKEIYEEILKNKLKWLKQQVTILENKKDTKDTGWFFGITPIWVEPIGGGSVVDTKKLDKQIQEYKSQIETLNKQLHDIIIHWQVPFARGIDFSDIFTGKWGFDIVVWNPPYVRQEAIEDPTWTIKDKKDYKNLLVDVVNQDWFDDIKRYRKDELKIGGRSDLYLYFYFRGLKLLNDQWVFTFITSNSWLDVDFWAILQEFLIKYCASFKVFDNQIQRSFASASINTIMVFMDKPVIESKDIMTGVAQFINFQKTYEESIWATTMAELDHQVINKKFESKKIKTGEVVFTKRTTDELRVIDIDSTNLWLDGSESIGSEWLKVRKYEGNKWGGKFLRAPEIFFTILEKGWDKIMKLWNLFSSTQRNTLQPFEKLEEVSVIWETTVPFLNSSKSAHSIRISDFNCYIDINKSKNKKSWHSDIVQKPAIISNRFIWERMFFIEWGDFLVWDTFFVWFLKDNSKKDNLLLLLNSTLSIFFVEIIGRKNMWEWVLLLYWPEFNQLPIYETNLKNKYLSEKSFINREVNSIFDELWLKKQLDIVTQTPNPLPDRKELDDIIFDELGLTQEERNEVYWSLAELVKARSDKAKSV